MKLLITGADGLVGSHFVQNYHPNSDMVILSPSINKLDITDKESVNNFFKSYKPDIIIHFAAFTDVSAAEQQRGNKNAPCWKINVTGTLNIIKSFNHQPYFIYISTDGVFSGSEKTPGPYDEDFPTEENPSLLSWYGWTKREGEKIISCEFSNAAILRIANPVRVSYEKKLDYVRKILSSYDNNQLYPMFNNQFLTLTYINEITQCLKVLLEKRLSGIYHVSSTDVFTPFKLANLLIDKARGEKKVVQSISIEGFLNNNPSRYPQYGGLKVKKTQKKLKLKFNKWEETIKILAKQFSI